MGKGLFTLDNVDTRMLYKEFQQGVEVYNEQTWGLVQRFIRSTTKESVKVWERDMEFEETAEGYLETWQKIHAREVSIGLKDFGLGFGFTKQAIQDQTADELRETQAEALRAHLRLLAKRYFSKVLSPASDKGFWDGNETTAPPDYKGNTFATSHTHYNTSGSATPTLADLNALKKHIREHGYAGVLYAIINTGTVQALEDLAGWTNAMTPVSIIETIAREGFEAVKVFQGLVFTIDDWVPENYIVVMEGQIKPITMREPLQPAGRGLKLYEGPYSDMPLREAYYEHRFDMEVVHRGAGAVVQITTGASYTKPTFTF